jgi:hypothetical protein
MLRVISYTGFSTRHHPSITFFCMAITQPIFCPAAGRRLIISLEPRSDDVRDGLIEI